ncbi:LPXN protein, partial [Mohoua ochrocephala]|nr:LPXN protein [Mohoua ochrocephala]
GPGLGVDTTAPPLSAMSSTPGPVPKPLLPSPPPTEAARQLDELLADLGHTQSKVSLGSGAGGWGAWPSPSPHHPPSWQLAAAGQGAGAPVDCPHSPLASSSQVLTALGKTWHPEHFTCARCGRELDKEPFFEQGGRAFCEEDYHQAFSPRCAYCASPIREVSERPPGLPRQPPPPPAPSSRLFPQKVLTALEKTWHPEHFFCAHCGKVFGNEGFLERNGKPYCHPDFLALFAPKCQGCERPVVDNYLSALEGVWHTECFVCTECLTGFSGGSFFELEGRPYCELHFHQRQGTVCHGCGRPVTGRCITAAGRRYHPEHFVCTYCLGRLHKGTVRECGDKMYCQPCYDKLFV